jgi:PAS domain S-box-containing protein
MLLRVEQPPLLETFLMSERKNLSETIRIDLIPGTTEPQQEAAIQKPAEAPAKAPVSPLTRVKWPKRAAEPTAVSRSRYQELLQSVYDAALVTNVFGKITDANVRAVEFLHFSREELCAMQVFDIISGADRSLMQTLCQGLEHERFTLIQAYCRRRDGSFFPAEIAVNKLHFGQMYLCFFIRDISVRKKAEDRLRTEHVAIQNAGTGIAIPDLDVTLEYVNPAFAGMLGYPRAADLESVDLRELLVDHTAADDLTKLVLANDQTWMNEMSMRRQDGEELFVQISAVCSRDDEGKPVNIVFSFADITEHKITETALATAQDDAAEQASELESDKQRLEEELAGYREQIEELTAQISKLKEEAATGDASG